MADTSLVFNVIGRDSGATDTVADVGRALITTGTVGAAAMKTIDHEVNKLDHDIDGAKRSLSALAREFAMTTAGVERNDIAAKMRQQSAELNRLSKARNIITNDDADAKALAAQLKRFEANAKSMQAVAKKQGDDIAKELASGIEGGGPAIKTALAAVFVAAQPFIGSLVAGAIVGVAGLGGIAGGVALAVRDPRVAQSWEALSLQGEKALTKAAAPFVPALMSAFGQIQREVPKLSGILAPMFSSLSRYVAPLTRGLLDFVNRFTVGFAQAAESAGPVIDVIAAHLGNIGGELGNLFETAGRHSEAGAQALDETFRTVEALITVTSGWIEVTATVYEWLSKIGTALGGAKIGHALGFLDDAGPTFSQARKASDAFAGSMKDTGYQASEAAGKIKDLYDATNELADSNLSAYEAQTKAKQAIADTTKEIRKNGQTTDINTAKGRANRDALTQLATAFNTVTTANDKAGVSSAKSIDDYNRQRDALIRAAKAAGMSEKAATDFANSVLKIPKARATTISANTGGAKNAIAGVASTLAKIPRQITVRIIAKAVGVSAASAAIKLAGKLAGGGPMKANLPYLVGEEGPELVVPDSGGTVMTADQTRSTLAGTKRTVSGGSLAARPIGGYGGGAQRIEVVGSDRLLVELVRRLIRTTNMVDGAIA